MFGWSSSVDINEFPIKGELPRDPEHPPLKGLTPPQRERLLNKPTGYTSWTPRLLAEYHAVGASGNVSVGSATTVVDAMEKFILESDIDGINIGHVVVS